MVGEETLLEKKPEMQETQALALTEVLGLLWLFSEAVHGKQTENLGTAYYCIKGVQKV